MANIQQLRDQTFWEAIDILETYKKCVIIRPTGFGKTGILSRFFTLHEQIPGKYEHIIYLYPADIVKDSAIQFHFNGNIPEDTTIENVTFISYARLINMTDADILNHKNTTLIIADECHKLGGPETEQAISRLLTALPDAHFLGATATPERMDLKDIIDIFFDNHVVSEYTLHDAFQDGILQRPYYVFCSYKTTQIADVEKEARLNVNSLSGNDRNNAEILLRSRLIEISNLLQMDTIIREVCNAHAADTNYMKFIVFFSSFQHIRDKSEDVLQWFQKAYPTHRIHGLTITSENNSLANNLNELPNLVYRNNTIDLIFCCDMLNLGYHVNSLTGICMYRGTQSTNIFIQQLGRVLSSGNNVPGIVFDWVDNIHRQSMYTVLGRKSKQKVKRKARYQELKHKLEVNDPSNPITQAETKELKTLAKTFERPQHWWTHVNDLQPQDLQATAHEATYRELIAKTVAEPISQRCRQAYAEWKEAGGDDSVYTSSYILAQKEPDAVPLPPYCYWKNVSVQAVLDAMQIPIDEPLQEAV